MTNAMEKTKITKVAIEEPVIMEDADIGEGAKIVQHSLELWRREGRCLTFHVYSLSSKTARSQTHSLSCTGVIGEVLVSQLCSAVKVGENGLERADDI